MRAQSMKLILLLTSFFAAFFPPPALSFNPAAADVRIDLTRVDANGNFSKKELLQRATRRSRYRLQRLTAISAGSLAVSSAAQAPVRAGNGEFLMDLAVGTPAVKFSAIIDTGSDLIWTQCQPCVDCFDQPSPIFDPAKSSSYSELPCSSALCTALPSFSCDVVGGGCDYLYSYGDSSSTQGVLATETFSFGLSKPAAIPSIGFGCGDDNQGAGFSQGGGLVGLGRGPLSLVSQLDLSLFSYCLTSLDATKTSRLLLGSLARLNASTGATAKLVKSAAQPSFYYLSLKGISVGGKPVAIPNGTFDLQSDGTGGLIIDSGTSITYLEEVGFRAVKKAFLKGIKLPAADGTDVGLDVCFKVPEGESEVEVPKLVLQFDGGGGGGGGSGGGNLELPAKNYMLLDSDTGLLCLTVMGSRGISILGNFQQQNMHVLYDLEKETLSFTPAQCEQLPSAPTSAALSIPSSAPPAPWVTSSSTAVVTVPRPCKLRRL